MSMMTTIAPSGAVKGGLLTGATGGPASASVDGVPFAMMIAGAGLVQSEQAGTGAVPVPVPGQVPGTAVAAPGEPVVAAIVQDEHGPDAARNAASGILMTDNLALMLPETGDAGSGKAQALPTAVPLPERRVLASTGKEAAIPAPPPALAGDPPALATVRVLASGRFTAPGRQVQSEMPTTTATGSPTGPAAAMMPPSRQDMAFAGKDGEEGDGSGDSATAPEVTQIQPAQIITAPATAAIATTAATTSPAAGNTAAPNAEPVHIRNRTTTRQRPASAAPAGRQDAVISHRDIPAAVQAPVIAATAAPAQSVRNAPPSRSATPALADPALTAASGIPVAILAGLAIGDALSPRQTPARTAPGSDRIALPTPSASRQDSAAAQLSAAPVAHDGAWRADQTADKASSNGEPLLTTGPAETDAAGTVPAATALPAAAEAAPATVVSTPTAATVAPVTSGSATTAGTGAVLAEQVIDMGIDGQWIDRLAREITQIADGTGHSRFQLSPPQLGRIQVDLWQGDDGAGLRMMTETDEAASRLSDGRASLQADARMAALTLSQIVIERAPGGNLDGQRDAQRQPQQDAQPQQQPSQTSTGSNGGNGQQQGQPAWAQGTQGQGSDQPGGQNGNSSSQQGKQDAHQSVLDEREPGAASSAGDRANIRYA